MEPLGARIRSHRRNLGLTLDELAGRTGISKPYLSLIETGRVPNPPSDEKLRRLEQALGFTPGELITQAHLQRTPRDVRAMLARLMKQGQTSTPESRTLNPEPSSEPRTSTPEPSPEPRTLNPEPSLEPSLEPSPLNLDDAYLSGILQELVDRAAGNVEQVATNAVPVINRISAGYPRDFTDLSYPPRVADDYVGCPDVHDPDAFAARVHGDSMSPKYTEGDIVIFSPALAPRNGDDCFVRFEDGNTTFKRVFFETADAGDSILRLQPRNEKYRPQTIPAEQVTGLYKAVYRYQRVDD